MGFDTFLVSRRQETFQSSTKIFGKISLWPYSPGNTKNNLAANIRLQISFALITTRVRAYRDLLIYESVHHSRKKTLRFFRFSKTLTLSYATLRNPRICTLMYTNRESREKCNSCTMLKRQRRPLCSAFASRVIHKRVPITDNGERSRKTKSQIENLRFCINSVQSIFFHSIFLENTLRMFLTKKSEKKTIKLTRTNKIWITFFLKGAQQIIWFFSWEHRDWVQIYKINSL